MTMSKEKHNSKANKSEFATPPKGLILFHLLALLVSWLIVVAHGELPEVSRVENDPNAPALYILGDSSVDCGDNTLFYPLVHSYLSVHSCNGSDSTLIPHLLAEKMGMPNILPFYSQNGSIDGILRGVNFGSAQATIMNPSSQGYQSVNQQLRQVFDSMQLLQLQLSQERALHFIRSSIFYLSFGKDDYINLYLRNASGAGKSNYTDQELSQILANQMIHVIRNLYDMNVRRVICMGILPLGCTPRMLLDWHSSNSKPSNEDDGRGCVEEINEQVSEYNKMLDEQISELRREFLDAQIVFCDVYQGIRKIINSPKHYGFEDVKSACCGLGMYGAAVGCLSIEMACDQSTSHVWWDLYNPSKAVNSLLAESAWTGGPLSRICRPTTIQELVSTAAAATTEY